MSDVFHVGVTGHRKLGADPIQTWRVFAECAVALQHHRDEAQGRGQSVAAWSCLAIGADSLFAQAALGLNIPLHAILPFADYPEDFSAEERPLFDHLVATAASVEWLPRKRRSNLAYLAAGELLVRRVDHLIAVWNGQPAAGKGGTGDVVLYARKRGVPVTVISVKNA